MDSSFQRLPMVGCTYAIGSVGGMRPAKRWTIMSNDNLTEDCPKCHCETADVIEYDGDEDAYLMVCDECKHTYWVDNEDGAWM